MPRTLVAVFFVALILASALVQTASAQGTPPSNRAWIIASDQAIGRDTLWFGHDVTGTYGIDPGLGEFEQPPFPPSGVWQARFVNIPGHDNQEPPAGLGQGTKEDYRQSMLPLPSSDRDTFRLKYQAGDGGNPVKFKWQISSIVALCDSAVIQDEFGGFVLSARMHLVDSLVVTNPALTQLLLIRYGQKDVSSVEPVGNVLPSEYALDQNYPNPFNPSTTIRFSVPRLAQTDVAVFDILGRRVASLVSEQLAPHVYSVTWEGKNDLGVAVASGMYLLRMSAVDESGANFTALRKLVLMK